MVKSWQQTKRRTMMRWVWWILVPLLLAACLPQGLQVPESPLLRRLERKSGLIAYVGVDGNIYTIDQGGGNQVQVTNDALLGNGARGFRFYQDPTWAPDGRKLAYLSISRSADAMNQVSLFTSTPEGAELTEAYSSADEFPFYLFWAPDSEQISFLSTTVSGAGMMLQVVSAEGGDAKVIDTGQPFYWDWAPDSRKLLIHAGEAGQERLAFLTLGGEVVERSLGVQPTTFQAPAWSPDGRELLMATEGTTGRKTLILTDQNGRFKKGLTIFDGAIAFDWSPDGENVAYITSETVTSLGVLGPLTLLSVDDGESFTTEEENVIAFFWSPDGRKIAYIEPVVAERSEEGGSNESSQPLLLLALYIMDVKSGTSERLMVYRPTQQFLRILPYFDQYHHSTTIWSPDSRFVVLSGFAGTDDEKIWIIAASGNLPPRVLTDGVLAFWSWQ